MTTLGLVGQSLYDKSVKELDKGDTIQSLKLLDELLKNDPQNIKGYYLRAQIFINTNQIDKGISDLDKLLDIAPTNKDALEKRCSAKETKGDFKGAIEDIDKRIKLEPANPEVYFERGYCDLMTFDWENAIRDYGKAIHLDSTYEDAYAGRGLAKLNALSEKGDVDPDGIEKASACSDLRKAKQLGFDADGLIRAFCEE